jgi:hypothetical protein
MTNAAHEEPQYINEDGVLYRRDAARHPLGPLESIQYYGWAHRKGDGFVTYGSSSVIVQGVGVSGRNALLRLVNRWNQGQPGTWTYTA